MRELWKQINNTEGYYEVSNLGRVQSWKKGNGHGRSSCSLILKQAPYDKYKHMAVRIKLNSKLCSVAVHKLVLETFVNDKPKGLQCRHLNGKAYDNRLSNLKWGTHQENRNDMRIHGTYAYGVKNGNSKLNKFKVKQIRKLYDKGKISQFSLAKIFGMEQTSISSIIRKETWAYI